MKLSQYLDSTYLKLSSASGITEEETKALVIQLIQEAIAFNFKLVMIRAEYITLAKQRIAALNSDVLVGTVIGFHQGTYAVATKLKEAQKAIDLGADELDFVLNYEAFKSGDLILVEEEIVKGTDIALENKKVVKWIIEVAALSNEEIVEVCSLIKNVVIATFGIDNAKNVFVKSSTGFYGAPPGKPNGATFESIKIMHKHASPLKIKAAGGVKTKEDAVKMIALGVQRIGTSSAKNIVEGGSTNSDY